MLDDEMIANGIEEVFVQAGRVGLFKPFVPYTGVKPVRNTSPVTHPLPPGSTPRAANVCVADEPQASLSRHARSLGWSRLCPSGRVRSGQFDKGGGNPTKYERKLHEEQTTLF